MFSIAVSNGAGHFAGLLVVLIARLRRLACAGWNLHLFDRAGRRSASSRGASPEAGMGPFASTAPRRGLLRFRDGFRRVRGDASPCWRWSGRSWTPRSSRSKARCCTATQATLDSRRRAAQDKVRQMGLWALEPSGRVRRARSEHGRARAAQRGARTQPARPPRVRRPGARCRQRRDPPRARHRRAAERYPAPARRRQDPQLLLDDRARDARLEPA